MPIFVYILLGIALLITLLLISKAKVFVCYENDLKVYAKFWFLKFNIVPAKEKKKPKKKTKTKKEPQKEKTTELTEQKPETPLVKKLWEMKNALLSILEKFMHKLHFRFIKLKVIVACDNAAKTALVYAGVNQGISYLIDILRNHSNVELANNSQIEVNTDFLSQKSVFEGKIELYIRVFPLLAVGFHALKEYIKLKALKEDNNGTDKAERNN